MLSRFQIKNFKSFRSAELYLEPLTVLIGANASGKTNLLEALQLLSWMASGRQLSQIGHHRDRQPHRPARPRPRATRGGRALRRGRRRRPRRQQPLRATPSFDVDELREWLPGFIEHATRGVGIADASLIELWDRQRELNPARRVLIWSFDEDLAGYDTGES